MIANHGQKVRYYHERVGCNSRLDTIQAAVLRIKLKHLDRYNNARRAAADFYDSAFANHPNIKTPYRAAYTKHVFHQYTLQLTNVNRDELSQYLTDNGVPNMIYYPVPAHRQNMFSFLDLPTVDLPVTDWLTQRVISLPIHTELDQDQLKFIVDHVNAFTQ